MKESDWTNSLPLDKIITHSKRCEDYLQGETMGESINIDLQKEGQPDPVKNCMNWRQKKRRERNG